MNIIHTAIIYQGLVLAGYSAHGPKLRLNDPRPAGTVWCLVCQSWVLPEQPTANEQFVRQLAAKIILLGEAERPETIESD